MKTKFAAAALALIALTAASSAEAAYRLCVRAGGFHSRHYPIVYLSVGGAMFSANNGGYYNANSGYQHIDTCFDGVTAFGNALVGWSTPHYNCLGANVPEDWAAEVWFVVDAVTADPSMGGRMPTCRRDQ